MVLCRGDAPWDPEQTLTEAEAPAAIVPELVPDDTAPTGNAAWLAPAISGE